MPPCRAALFLVGAAFFACGRPEARWEEVLAEAEAGRFRALDRWVDAHPTDALGWATRAEHHRAAGRWAQAMGDGNQALALDPGFWEAAYNLACAHAARSETGAALQALYLAQGIEPAVLERAAADPDLEPLRDDHRFALLLSSGFLARTEDDGVAQVSSATVRAGEPVVLDLFVLSLNRPLLEPRPALELRSVGPVALATLTPLARTERFQAGEAGGKEYQQRALRFEFVPLSPGELLLGPFELGLGERTVRIDAVFVRVLGAPEPGAAAPEIVERFFRAPSEAEGAWMREHLDDRCTTSPDVPSPPWCETPEARGVRMRVIDPRSAPTAWPAPLTPRFRSTYLRRATEGWSWVIDTTGTPAG